MSQPRNKAKIASVRARRSKKYVEVAQDEDAELETEKIFEDDPDGNYINLNYIAISKPRTGLEEKYVPSEETSDTKEKIIKFLMWLGGKV